MILSSSKFNTLVLADCDCLPSGYQRLLSHIPHAAWIMRKDGTVCAINPVLESYAREYPAGSQLQLGELFWTYLRPTEQSAIKASWQSYQLGDLVSGEASGELSGKVSGEAWQHRLSLWDMQNNYRQFDAQIELLTKADEAENSLWLGIAVPVVAADSTDEASEETQVLRRNAAFIQRILESNQDCIKVLDLKGHLLYMNNGGQDLMEIDDFNGQVRSALWFSFWSSEVRSLAEAAFEEALSGGIGRFEGFCATAKGTPKWWEVVVSPIRGDSGEVVEVLSVSRDITQRKRAQQELRERNAELSQFTQVVSHDLKAPLRGVASLSEWIKEDLLEQFGEQLPDEISKNLQSLQVRVMRMGALIDGLLKIARVGRQEVSAEQVDVDDLIAETLDSLAPAQGFEVVVNNSLLKIKARRLLLSQVLSNLLGNAIKHHHQSEGKIVVSAVDKGSWYEFSVADDGPGIPVDKRDRIFNIFETLDADKSNTTNTGIGLALVRKLVQSEGGDIWIDDSGVEKGSRFCFTWPKFVA